MLNFENSEKQIDNTKNSNDSSSLALLNDSFSNSNSTAEKSINSNATNNLPKVDLGSDGSLNFSACSASSDNNKNSKGIIDTLTDYLPHFWVPNKALNEVNKAAEESVKGK